jgi:L-fuculose-phosphate aldolase
VRERAQERYREFSEIGRDIFVSGLISSHGGNMSVRAEERIVITRTGSMLGRLAPTDLIAVPFEEGPPTTDAQASVELLVHRALYHALPDMAAVVHTHSPYTIAASLCVDEIAARDSEAELFIPRVPVVWAQQTVASADVARLVPEAMNERSCPVVVVRGHGPFAVGRNLAEAYRWVSVLEMSARVLCAASLFKHTDRC